MAKLSPLLFALACACTHPQPAPSTPAASHPSADDAAFGAVADRFLERYLALHPVEATQLGEHRHDGRWEDLSAAGDDRERELIGATLGELAGLSPERLSLQHRIDYQILASRLAYNRFTVDELRPAENDPLVYTALIGQGIEALAQRDFAPANERMRSLGERLRGVGAIVKIARQRLRHPPRLHTETAIQQTAGLIKLVREGLTQEMQKAPTLRRELESAAMQALAALEELKLFFEDTLLAASTGDFRLGRPLFEKKLRFVLDDAELDIDALGRDARAKLASTQAEMYETALALWTGELGQPAPPPSGDKKAFIKKVLDRVAEDRPDAVKLVDEARASIKEAAEFVRKHELMTVPDEPLEVVEMPEHRRGISTAYCDASGPLEKKPQVFYAIAPAPADWPKARVDSFYREYNRAMLVDLGVHEAIPGHYLQLMHSARYKSPVRAVFSSGAFVEGWAKYAEWLMAKRGFGGLRVRLQRQKMELRSLVNAILDYEIHAGQLDEKGALALMVGEAFQEEGEATGKWRRARLTSAQLTTYHYGFYRLLQVRKLAEQRPGFRERDFHDRLLSSGSPPPRYLSLLVAK